MYFDTSLTMERQVNAIPSARYCHIRSIGRIRQYFTTDAYQTLTRDLVIFHLDYGNALLFCLSSTLMERLRRAQHSTGRLVTHTRKRGYMTPVLNSVHYLPVLYKSQCKIPEI